MEIRPESLYVGRSVNLGRAGYPHLPTARSIDVAFGGERVLTGPEPARATIELWWPDTHGDHRPKLRDVVIFRVVDVDTGSRGSIVTTFAGRVDGIERERRPAPPSEVERRPAPPTILTRTWWAGSNPYPLVGYEWVQNGVSYALGALNPAETWRFPAYPDNDDELFPTDDPISYVVPIDARDVPAGSALNVAEHAAPGDHSAWSWRANGTLYPVRHGPLVLDGAAPADLALVCEPRPLRSAPPPVIEAPRIYDPSDGAGIKPAGEWITVTASDWLADAGRIKVGDAPWPAQTPRDRWDAIAARVNQLELDVPILTSDSAWEDYADDALRPDVEAYGRVVARDVDNQPILDLLRETLASVGAAPVAVEDGIVPWRASTYAAVLNAAGTIDDHPAAVPIAPRAVGNLSIAVRSTDVVNRAVLTYVDVTGDEPTERRLTLSWPSSIRTYGEQSATWSTAAEYTGGDPDERDVIGPLVDRVRAAVGSMAEPSYVFTEPIVLTPKRIKSAGTNALLALVDVEQRHGAALKILHDLPDVTTRYALRAGSLVVEDGRVIVTLEPEPAGQSGAPGVTFEAVAASLPTLTLSQLDTALSFTDFIPLGVAAPGGTRG